MAKNKLIVDKWPDSDLATVRYGDKVTALGHLSDGFLITHWDVHMPHMGWDEKALRAMKRKFGQIGVGDGGTTDKQDFKGFDTFYYWMEKFDEDLVNAVRYYNHIDEEWEWVSDDDDNPEENPRGGKRKIPRKKKKFYLGISDDLLDTFERDIVEQKAKKISRHLFMLHLYKHTKKRELPVAEEQAGYGEDPMNQDTEVEYYLSKTRSGIEIVYFITPRSGDTMFIFGALGSA